jgi:signal transduction histidine kinase
MTVIEASESSSPRLTFSRRQKTQRGLMIGAVVAVLVLALWAGNVFASVRLRLTDLYFVPQDTSGTVVIVALDNASLEAYGRSIVEWDRELYADLLMILNEGGARVVGLDVLFAESTPNDAALAEAIQAIRFAENSNRTRTIVPQVGVPQVQVPEGHIQSVEYENVLSTQPDIAAAATDLAFVNTVPDVDGTVRRQSSLIYEDDELRLSFSLAMLMAYSGIPPQAYDQLLIQDEGLLRITPELTPDRVLRVDERGFWLQNYFGRTNETFEVYSMQAILNGEVDPAVFEDKIVMVGLHNATGVLDTYNVPLSLDGGSMPGIEIHANAVETLLQEVPLREPSPIADAAIIIVLSVLAGVAYANVRYLFLPFVTAFALIAFGVAAFLIFPTQHLIIDLLDGGLALLMPSVLVAGVSLFTEVQQRRKTEFLLESLIAVSRQQLNFEKIGPLITGDIQRAIRTRGGSLWLWDETDEALKCASRWGSVNEAINENSDIFKNTNKSAQPVQTEAFLGIPILWQGRLLGSFFVEVVAGPLPRRDPVQLLNTLSKQIAPSLENARLFAETEQQKRLLQAIQDASPNGLIVLDNERNMLICNPQAQELLEIDVARLTGKSVNQLLRAAGINAEMLKEIQGGFSGGKAFRQLLRVGKNAIYLDGVPLPSDEKWLVILSDVSTLADLNELKTQMIRMASHDLKNPLSRVMGFSSLLGTTATLTEKEESFLQRIDTAVEDMNNIIEDVLNLEQLRSTRALRELISFANVVSEVIETHSPDAEERKQSLSSNIQENILPVLGDSRLLTQAVSNLVNNAIKYTPNGGTIEVLLKQQDGTGVLLEVKDNGYGIPKDAQDRLFTEFYRVKSEATIHIPGTGLGLSLVKSVIDEHDGKVWVNSEEGQGSSFFVEIPFSSDQSG